MTRRAKRSAIAEGQVSILDIGARGKLPSPWLRMNLMLRVDAFDPDGLSVVPETVGAIETRIHPYALYSGKGSIEFFESRDPAQSSLYRPSDSLHMFQESNYANRDCTEVHDINVISIDSILGELPSPVSAMKIDVQGGEYDVLLGAAALISRDLPLIFVETWIHEVYLGAPRYFDVAKLLSSFGYELFESQTAAAWHYENARFRDSRPRLVGQNLLFVPSLELASSRLPRTQLRRLMVLLDYWGYGGAALRLAELSGDKLAISTFSKPAALSRVLPPKWYGRWSRMLDRRWRRLT